MTDLGLIRRRMIFTSACVGLHRFPGEPVALGENFIDLVGGLPPVAGRPAGTERRLESQAWHLLPPGRFNLNGLVTARLPPSRFPDECPAKESDDEAHGKTQMVPVKP